MVKRIHHPRKRFVAPLPAVILAAFVLGLLPAAHAQLLGDEAPYFLWPDAWSGTLHGRDELKRATTVHGVTVNMANTTEADARVTYDTFNGFGFAETWQGEHNTAQVTFGAGAFVHAGAHAHVKDSTTGKGEVGLDNDASSNGVMIDLGRNTFTLALHTCSIIRCDKLAVTEKGTVSAPGFARSFGGASSDKEGVGLTATVKLPAPGNGLKGRFAPPPKPISAGTDTVTLTYDLQPTFAIDAWAKAYRARYLAARQSDLDVFKDYTPEKCQHSDSSPCRAAKRARRLLSANADAATSDFKRVVSALIQRQCQDFTRQLNLAEHRDKDIVIEGPIATYNAVREVLKRSVVSDPHVSYNRLPSFMRCLYDYDTFLKVVTRQQPGLNPWPF